LASTFDGIFHGCIGISDVKEFEIEKPGDPVMERRSFSGKKKINTFKMLSAMDHSGNPFVHIGIFEEALELDVRSILHHGSSACTKTKTLDRKV
jgi:hypothetical protein